MKRTLTLLAILLCAAFVAQLWAALPEQGTQKKKDARQVAFMRQKLTYSQLVLEGLALENYDLISTNGRRMLNMNQDSLWRQMLPEEYQQYSQAYRQSVVAIITAAQERKLDAAMEAYSKSLQNCYDCHKHFRIVERAKLATKKPHS